jgi:hypothetical protein
MKRSDGNFCTWLTAYRLRWNKCRMIVSSFTILTVEEAYQQLRGFSSNSNRRLVDVARSVMEAGEVFRQLEQAGAKNLYKGIPVRSPARDHSGQTG